MTATEPNVIGRFVVVVYKGKSYVATVIDKLSGTNLPKRVRIQQDVELQGAVLFPNQYKFKCFAEQDD